MVTGPVFISEQLQLELQSKLNMGMGQNWLPEEISIVHIKNSTKPSVVPRREFRARLVEQEKAEKKRTTPQKRTSSLQKSLGYDIDIT